MTTPSNIDVPGLLKNCLHVGVSIQNAIMENIDNSLSAGSTEIGQYVTDDGLSMISADNGTGMSADALEQSCRLHSRSFSTSDRHGRFGFGGKQAQITLTNLEGPVTKLSSDGTGVSQITIDYLKIVQTGFYFPQAHSISAGTAERLWNDSAINPSGSGTVICSHLAQKNRTELIDLLMDTTVSGFRFEIATTYRHALKSGVKMPIKVGNFKCQIYPFDRLGSSWIDRPLPVNIHFKHETFEIDVLRNTITGEIIAHVITPEGRMRLNQQKQQLVSVSEPLDLESLESVGRVRVTFAYSNNWSHLQKYDLEQNDIIPLHKGQSGVAIQRERTNGRELVRNNKVIKHFVTNYKNVQNAMKEFYNETRDRIEFDASEIMDDEFKVQVNKSQVDRRGLVRRNVWNTIDRLRQTFITECYKLFKTADKSPDVPLPSIISDTTPPPVATLGLGEGLGGGLGGLGGGGIREAPAEAAGNANVNGNGAELEICSDSDASENEDENYAPDSVRDVGPSVHESIIRDTGEKILAGWKHSGIHTVQLEEITDGMIVAYQNRCAQDQLQCMLRFMIFEEKYNLLIHLIKLRHPSQEERMFKGIELQRKYSNLFGSDAIIGL